MSNTRKLRRPPARRAPYVPAMRTTGSARSATASSSLPRCDCSHGSGPNTRPCHRPAHFRVTVVCTEPGCDDAAASYLLCGTCTDNLLDEAAAYPHGPELRISAL